MTLLKYQGSDMSITEYMAFLASLNWRYEEIDYAVEYQRESKKHDMAKMIAKEKGGAFKSAYDTKKKAMNAKRQNTIGIY